MSADRLVTVGGRRLSAVLADLGVNAGRKQSEHPPTGPAGRLGAYGERRVIIDLQTNGEFSVYSDSDVQVICRCAHIPEDELCQINRRPIPEQWLDMPVGYNGDGTVADLLAKVVADWPTGDPA